MEARNSYWDMRNHVSPGSLETIHVYRESTIEFYSKVFQATSFTNAEWTVCIFKPSRIRLSVNATAEVRVLITKLNYFN